MTLFRIFNVIKCSCLRGLAYILVLAMHDLVKMDQAHRVTRADHYSVLDPYITQSLPCNNSGYQGCLYET